jgi:membrane fusion protein
LNDLSFGGGRVASQPSLFRQEVIDFQQHNRQWGQVALLQPLSTKIITWFIAAVFLLFVAFLFLGQYARKETVTGYLTPAAGTAKIFAPRQGTIKEIYVKEGQQVEKAVFRAKDRFQMSGAS